MNAQRLPANWTDSANALEGIASVAKDTLLLVDEFTPSDAMSTQQLHGKAERLFRAQANHTGRKRMRADTTLRPAKPPEGLVLATGEDIPSGQSLRSRIILIEHRPRSVNLEKLSACQNDAAAGLYAQAMAGFVEWLAPQIGDIKGRWQQELAALRQKVSQSDMHSRTPENIASLALGWRYFLGFAIESKAMAPSEAMVCWMDVWEILKTVAATQGQHLAAAEPASRFLDLLRDALMSQKAYLRNIMPEGSTIEPTPQPGTCVGWDHPQEDRVYLIPDVSYAEAHELGRQSGSRLSCRHKPCVNDYTSKIISPRSNPGRARFWFARHSMASARAFWFYIEALSTLRNPSFPSNPSIKGMNPLLLDRFSMTIGQVFLTIGQVLNPNLS